MNTTPCPTTCTLWFISCCLVKNRYLVMHLDTKSRTFFIIFNSGDWLDHMMIQMSQFSNHYSGRRARWAGAFSCWKINYCWRSPEICSTDISRFWSSVSMFALRPYQFGSNNTGPNWLILCQRRSGRARLSTGWQIFRVSRSLTGYQWPVLPDLHGNYGMEK